MAVEHLCASMLIALVLFSFWMGLYGEVCKNPTEHTLFIGRTILSLTYCD